MADGRRMGKFWDERAAEDAYWYVDNRLAFKQPEQERFWTDGKRDLETLLELAGARIEPGSDVVEIGCGLGRLTRAIAPQCGTVRALDVSSEMLRRAAEHNPGLADSVTWIHGDGTSLSDIDDDSADACVSHVVFQHIPDPDITLGYIREMGRILRPGGWSAFQVSNDPRVHAQSLSSRTRSWAKALLSRGPGGVSSKYWLGSCVTVEAVTAAARDGGLEVERMTGEGTQYCMVKLVAQPS